MAIVGTCHWHVLKEMDKWISQDCQWHVEKREGGKTVRLIVRDEFTDAVVGVFTNN